MPTPSVSIPTEPGRIESFKAPPALRIAARGGPTRNISRQKTRASKPVSRALPVDESLQVEPLRNTAAFSPALRQGSTHASNDVRNQVVMAHVGLVRAIALRVHDSLPVHVDLDDMIHAGILGLLDAAEKYDSGKDVAFQSYAKHRIRGAILDSLRQQDWASRDLRKRHKQFEAVSRELAELKDELPSENEIAEKMGLD